MSRTQCGAKCRAAKPGPFQRRCLLRSRVCSAPAQQRCCAAALRPGHAHDL